MSLIKRGAGEIKTKFSFGIFFLSNAFRSDILLHFNQRISLKSDNILVYLLIIDCFAKIQANNFVILS